jgi:uncharacterized protein YecT (DUF1311 family)
MPVHPFACFAATLALMFASAARAEDCSKAETQTDINQCAGRNYEAADKVLNGVFEKAIAKAKQNDHDVEGVKYSYEEALRTAQRAWIAFRDADCTQPPRELAGSISTMDQLNCMTDRTTERTDELKGDVSDQ